MSEEIKIRLNRLKHKMRKRLDSYEIKKSNASGTDKINQGAKIKATMEFLQDVQCEIDSMSKNAKGPPCT